VNPSGFGLKAEHLISSFLSFDELSENAREKIAFYIRQGKSFV